MSSKKSKRLISLKQAPSRSEPLEKYRNLSPSDRAFVQLMSVVYEPLNGAKALQALTAAKVYTETGRPFDVPSYRQTLGKLIASGLITTNNRMQTECDPKVAEVATRDAIREGRFPAMADAAARLRPVTRALSYVYFESFRHAVRDFRILFYRGDLKDAYTLLNIIRERYEWDCRRHDPLLSIADAPFDAEWFAGVPHAMAEAILCPALQNAAYTLKNEDEKFRFLSEHWDKYDTGDVPPALFLLLAEQSLWRGNLRELEPHLKTSRFVFAKFFLAAQALLDGNAAESLRLYEDGLEGYRAVTRKRNAEIEGLLGLLYALALIHTGDRKQIEAAKLFLRRHLRKGQDVHATSALLHLAEESLGEATPCRENNFFEYFVSDVHPPLDSILIHLVLCWHDDPESTESAVVLERQFSKAVAGGYPWLAAETASALLLVKPNHQRCAQFAKNFYEQTGMKPMSSLIQKREAWERGLEALAAIAQAEGPQTDAGELRLAWWITMLDSSCSVEAREVKKRSGGWTKGKAISPKRLSAEKEKLGYLTPQDREACSHILVEVENGRYYGSRTYFSYKSRILLALVGHPLVFWHGGGSVEVVRGEPELRVVRNGKRVVISMSPSIPDTTDVSVVKETAARIRVVEFSAAHRRIAGILGKGLEVPAEHESRVLQALSSVASLITIHSNIGGSLENVPQVPADARPRVVLVPSGNGLRVQLMAQPLAGGAYYRPGSGGETVMAEVNGQRVQTTRDLEAERKLASEILTACPTLGRTEEIDGEWFLDDPGECLELLAELHELGDTAVVEWPQGEKLRVSQTATFANLQFRLKGNRDWFEASGNLRLDDGRVMDMRQLLELLEQAPGRFVPLGDGEYLALTKEFRKRLDEFRVIAESQGKTYRIHPLAAPSLESLVDSAGEFKADDVWKKHIERFREAQTVDAAVPSTFRATLRDYQAEGVQWLTRLDYWGAGACLADDMGLGKTVQALAFILSKAAEGPALVIAPTSVCMNWIDEAQRFAPSLNAVLFGPGDRQTSLESLGPMNLLVCSYGLLYQEEERLAARQWRIVVLDEAQAIKNVATRRSKAAMNLQADFRLITTGTPIENHLGELWNLFRFINRGLLGSLDQFNARFANPIERRQDREARNRLKRIIQPFVLRRVKEDVLEELPARTEILLHVEFSDEEAAFYEALRQQAIDKLAKSDGNAGQKHLQILAEIMRLRRACCNPQLVSPEMAIPSTKLSVFLDLVDELVENRHKALVFSQFVDHLSILRGALDARGIAYQYLDGSTPQRERKRRVDAFQSGEGDLFLISLKAGGLGLNLTAADYVIHMDPWWNPAVEDQASDRAHRIGQQRPVTIYRLVTKDTIESKIVALHSQKRDLADSLLEGAEMTGKMSAEELLALLQGTL
ncbi:MAG: DEAD/DEAH box helicase [Candidatus Hydrogenedentes bacterium]|nr:DEAD/DEAH box helicase [Candidatus Hydrogenedentota bacterium]